MRFHLEVKPTQQSNFTLQTQFYLPCKFHILSSHQCRTYLMTWQTGVSISLVFGHVQMILMDPPKNLCLWFIVCNILPNYFLLQTIFMDGGSLLKQLALLTDEVKSLETETHRGSESSSGSPRQVSSHALRGSASFGHRDLFSPTGSVSPRSVAGPGSRSRKGS